MYLFQNLYYLFQLVFEFLTFRTKPNYDIVSDDENYEL